jgi:hypothetical protein
MDKSGGKVKRGPRTTSGKTEPVFTVTLDKGMASRHRLPLADVIRFLSDLKNLVIETGKAIERENGVLDPSGDYGLEVLADGNGRFLAKSSVRTSIAITRNIEAGSRAVAVVLSTLRSLNAAKDTPRKETPLQATVIYRLDKLAFINTQNKVDAKFTFVMPVGLRQEGKGLPVRATFDDRTIQRIREYNPTPVFLEEGIHTVWETLSPKRQDL